MAKEKPKITRLSFAKGSIDPALSRLFFDSVCDGDREVAGNLVEEFMRQQIEATIGAPIEPFVEAMRQHMEK